MDTDPRGIAACFAPNLFAGKRVLVSGASSGIGLAIARGFAAAGANVLATGSSAAKLAGLAQDPGSAGLSFARFDVRDAAATIALMEAQPRLDVLINAAGIAQGGVEYELGVFVDTVDVNLTASMRAATAARPKLRQSGGCIINIASILSFQADPAVPAYTASKTGLLGLTRALAHGFGADGIRVNAIAPGYHKTEMTKPLWSQPHNHDVIARQTAMGRWGATVDLVGAALFLASPAATYITGICLPVDGGYSVKAPTE